MALTRLGTDAIGTTIPVSKGGTGVTTAADLANTGNYVKIASATASGDTEIEFTTGIDSTYKSYMFMFTSVHPSADTDTFRVAFSSDGGSTYGLSKTATYFRSYIDESGNNGALSYLGSKSYGSRTATAFLAQGVGGDADQSFSGEFWLYNPASTTYMKNYKGIFITPDSGNYAIQQYVGGYIQTTSAVDAVKFSFSSANVDDGEITMYGVKV